MVSASPDSETERKVQFLLHTVSHGYKQIVRVQVLHLDGSLIQNPNSNEAKILGLLHSKLTKKITESKSNHIYA